MFLSRKEMFALIVFTSSTGILLGISYLLTQWNPQNITSENVAILLALLPFLGGAAGSALVYGFKPRADRFFAKDEKDNSEEIKAHKKDLTDKFEHQRAEREFPHINILMDVRYFRYRKAFLHHLGTGHCSLFDLIGEFTSG